MEGTAKSFCNYNKNSLEAVSKPLWKSSS